MKTPQELLSERIDRVHKAIALEKTDRTPVVLLADTFCAKHMGVKLSEMCKSIKISNKAMLDSLKALGDVDGINAAFSVGQLFPMMFMSKVKLPGRELPDDMLWQLDESERMTPEDYDTILSKGWKHFGTDYMENRLDLNLEEIFQDLSYSAQAVKNMQDEGFYVYSPTSVITVNEYLSGGRSMAKFMKDLYKMPDKVEATLDVILREDIDSLKQQIRAANASVVFLSPARGASEFFSPRLWERFV